MTRFSRAELLPEHFDLEPMIEALRTNYHFSEDFTADSLRDFANALNAKECDEQAQRQRAMNTNIKYPTSTPSWARRRK